jgi:hypothetical protein
MNAGGRDDGGEHVRLLPRRREPLPARLGGCVEAGIVADQHRLSDLGEHGQVPIRRST